MVQATRIQIDTGLDRDEAWDDFVLNHADGSFCHLSAWRNIIGRLFGHEVYYLSLRRGDSEVLGVLPIVRICSRLFGDFLVSVPYLNYGGILADSPASREEIFRALSTLCTRLGVHHAELRETAADTYPLPVRTDKVAVTLSLPDHVDDYGKLLGSKKRSQIRRSQRANPQLKIGGAELIGGFYHVFSKNMRDLGTPVYPQAFFEAIAAEFADRVTVVTISIGGEPGAGAFLIDSGDSLHIPWASCLRDHNPISLNMRLYWEVLSMAIRSGVRKFDFGRSTRGSGPHKFKQQWLGEDQPLHWYYWLQHGQQPPKLNPDNPKYRLAISAWQRLPLPVANWLGPKIVRNLP